VVDSSRQSALATIEIPTGNARIGLSERRSRYLMQINGAPAGQALAAMLSTIGFSPDSSQPEVQSEVGAPAMVSSDLSLLWNGPGMWFAVSDSEQAMHRLGDGLANSDATITDLSQARTVFRLTGSESTALLSKGCPVDLESMSDNTVVSSHIGHFNTLIHKMNSDTYDIYVFRSFGLALYEWLADAAVEWSSG